MVLVRHFPDLSQLKPTSFKLASQFLKKIETKLSTTPPSPSVSNMVWWGERPREPKKQ